MKEDEIVKEKIDKQLIGIVSNCCHSPLEREGDIWRCSKCKSPIIIYC